MLKHIYKGIFGVLLIGFAACSAELTEEDLTPGTTPIRLTGTVTRTDGTSQNTNLADYSGLYLSSKVATDPTKSFFENIAITDTKANGKDDKKSDLTTAVYYPLNKSTKISLYGHTGIVTDGTMSLTSGTAIENDALISNGTNGQGTEGCADTPVELLTFRHVMTRLEIAIVIAESETEDTKPLDSDVKIEFSGIKMKGKYSITADASNDEENKATDCTETYTLGEGIHYLVPTGEDLTGNKISSLEINDYTATPEDLTEITIPVTDSGNNLVLKPGLAYKLTFTIKRLKITGIKLTVEDWATQNLTPEWGYDPYTMELAFTQSGSTTYDATDEDNQIKQVVLHHEVGGTDYQYVGTGSYENGKTTIKFLSVPRSLSDASTLSIDAYTKYGLLVRRQNVRYKASTSGGADDKGKITLALASNGMTTDGENKYQVTTPLQFYNLLTKPEGNKTYVITQDINMDALSDMPATRELKDFPEDCTLETKTITFGNSSTRPHTILSLKQPLFATNKGTISGLYIFSGSITGSGDPTGSICNVNEGTIAGCVNEAEIKNATGTVGGICGKNSSTGTILACLNTGNIESGTTVGGICGTNERTEAGAIKACINTGMLNKNATNLGGICGTTSTTTNKVVNTCYWLTGTARKDQAVNNEVAIGGENNSGCYEKASDLAPTRLRNEETITALKDAAGTSWNFVLQTTVCVWPMPLKAGN